MPERAGSNKETVGNSLIVCFVICTRHIILFGRSNQGEWDGWGMWHVLEGMIVFWWGYRKESDSFEHVVVRSQNDIKRHLK